MKRSCFLRATSAFSGLLLLSCMYAWSAGSQVLHGHVPGVVKSMQPLGDFPVSNRLDLAIGLPLRNREVLTNLLQQVYDPTSPNFHHYLTPQQFTEQFGPNESDYNAVMNFAKANGLTVTGTHPNRTLLDVSGTAADIEKTFHINLRIYRHPTEARTFYAPDSEPSVDLTIPILEVAGLNNYVLPRPMYRHISIPSAQSIAGKPAAGSGSYGTYMGNDFRTAYIPGVSLTGSGQSIGLFELDGYYTNDPVLYARQAGLTNTFAITNVLVDGFNGTPGGANGEVALDIEMVMCMAPGAQIMVYEGSTTTPTVVIDTLNRMANDDLAQQLSSSWTYETGPNMEQAFQQMDAQGQSFFNCSGDDDAYSGTVTTPADDPYITIVGGTILSTSGAGSNWVSETAWNRGNGKGSGGGISTVWTIPSWQQGINMSANQGSTTMRNLPDVAMVAEAVYAVADNGTPQYLGGTSVATPLWAAFTALVNQQAALQGKQTVGFLNPAIYAIGQGANYGNVFHDITTGNNTNSSSPNNFFAVPGFDLCTGWGSPTTNLINVLLNIQFVLPTGWTLTSLPNEDWDGVASSADGTMLIAADLSGSHQINVSSTSGATWRSYGPGASWRGLASSADGTKLAAAAWDGPVYRSVNSGVTWTATASPFYSWRALASSADGSKLAACAFWESVVEVTTNSGLTWQVVTGAPCDGGIAWSADGSVFAAANGSGTYVSTNSGVTGISANVPGMNFTSVASSADGSILYAAGGSVYMSTNRGTSWTICGSLSGAGLVACSSDGYRVAAVADQIYLSDDKGTTWVGTGPRTPPTYYSWSTIACSADGSRLIAAISDYYDGPVYTGVFPRSGPIIKTPPVNQSVVVSNNAVFSVIALGPPPLTYQWSFNGTNISGATNSSLTLNDVQFSQAGYYGVVVSDAYGSRFSPNAALNVLPPPVTIVVEPTNQTAVIGTTVSFAVGAEGAPPLTFQWMFNNMSIAGATNSVLTLFNVQPNNAGTYAVTVANAYGPSTSSNAELTLISSTPCLQPPSGLVDWWPAEGNATDRMGINNGTPVGNLSYGAGKVGQCFVLDGNTAAIDLANNLSVQMQGFTIEMWIKRSSATLSSQSGGKAFLFAFGGDGFGLFDSGTLFWQSGCCYGTGSAISDTNWHHVAVTVTTTGDSVYIDGIGAGGSMWPQGENFVNVAIGARGDTLANSFYGAIDEVGFFNRVLSSAEIQSIYNAGAYGMCWVPAPPFIVTQPTSKTAVAGSSATFSITVAGWLQSLGYQWLFNGTAMVGMTNSSLLIQNAQSSQVGNYSVVVTNIYGAVTSSVVSLSVTGTSQYTAYPTNGLVPLTVQFNGPSEDSAGNNIVQWSWNFGDGSTSSLQNPIHVYTTVGSFSHVLVATNSLGFAVSSTGPAITTSLPTYQYTASQTKGLVPLAVQFNGLGADSGGNAITQWGWNFGDGSTSSLQNPIHVYASVGNFSPGLVVTNNLGFAISGTGPAITTSLPTYQYTVSPTNGLVPLAVQFNCPGGDSGGNAITQWSWNFGDGSTSTLQNPIHVYASVGNFSPGLVVTNNLGFAISGTGPAITTSLPTYQYTASPTNGRIPLVVQFNAPLADNGGNVITEWNWNFGDGSTSALQNPVHAYSSGIFHPSLFATNNLNFTVLGSGPPVIKAADTNDLVVNGGFETGDFTGWTLLGDNYWTVVDNGDESAISPHSGSYEAALGTLDSFGNLSQILATTPGTSYWLSCWLNHSGGDPNDIFMVSWNGTTLLAETNPPAPSWTNLQFVVSSTGTNAVLQFDYEASDIDYLDIDDVSVVALPPPSQTLIAGVALSGSNLVINGTNGIYGQTYYILATTNLALPKNQWIPITTNVLNANGNFTITATNAVNPNIPQAFYILQAQ